MSIHVAVLGIGALGGVMGGLITRTGLRTTLIARGPTLDRLRTTGLTLHTPDWTATLDVQTAEWTPDDVDLVFLTIAAGDVEGALAQLPTGVPVVCLFNGPTDALTRRGHPIVQTSTDLTARRVAHGISRLQSRHPGIRLYSEHARLAKLAESVLSLARIECTIIEPDPDAVRQSLLAGLADCLHAACGSAPEDLLRPLERQVLAGLAVARPSIELALHRSGAWRDHPNRLAEEASAIYRPVLRAADANHIEVTLLRRLLALTYQVHPRNPMTEADVRTALTDPNDYRAAPIRVLEGIEPVRRRPGMYFGDIGQASENVALEVIANTVDVHLSGKATRMDVELGENSLRVSDDGPGIPHGYVGTWCTRLSHRGVRDDHWPHVHLRGGLVGVGLPAVNAVSRTFRLTNTCNGSTRVVHFEYGRVKHGEPGPIDHHGVTVELEIDRSVDGLDTPLPFRRISHRLRAIAALTELKIHLNGAPMPNCGLEDWVAHLSDLDRPADLRIQGRHNDVEVNAVLWWTDAPRRWAYVNLAPVDSGDYVRSLERLVGRPMVLGIDVRLDDPRFGNPTRDWLRNPEAVEAIEALYARAIAEPGGTAP